MASLCFAPMIGAQDDSVEGRRWFIDVQYSKLKPISIAAKGGGPRRVFWYVTLKLTNKTGKARTLDLSARALTPQVKRAPIAMPGLYPEVTSAIAKKERKKKLVNIFLASGELADGASKEIVILFPKLSRLANRIDVRVSGLTNTLYRAGKTVWREDTELSIKFHRIGDEYDVTRNQVRDMGKSWMTVSRKKVRG